ncbi:MAG TPA: DNA sulfur modification protein DndB [Gemmatimonadales bacterium]|nr:DNA sulfur modification protein DndB [Gemmatimonadales bacterium]
MTGIQAQVEHDTAPTSSVEELIRSKRERGVKLLGYLELNQGRPTFTGRMTLEEFADLTVVHNRRWAGEAGETLDIVTQREIIENHANGLATFMLQGLVAATIHRVEKEEGYPETVRMALNRIQQRIGGGKHFGLPQVTLVYPGTPLVTEVKEEATREVVAHRLFLPAGKLFIVADGQHRREAARRVRDFLNDTIANRRTPRKSRIYPAVDAPLTAEETDAWTAVHETFRSATLISYEAHIGLNVDEARQLFTNYNCHVKPVKADLNLTFDQANPINQFAKDWLIPRLQQNGEQSLFDLRQLATINGLLCLNKTTIRNAPYNASELSIPKAKEFWSTVLSAPEWNREGTLLREVPVLKALAKAWYKVHLAGKKRRSWKADQLRDYITKKRFDRAWVESVPGLKLWTVPAADGGFRFSPAHNEIVAAIVADVLK